MSAVRGLQSYIAKTAAARERVDLGQNQSRRAKRRSRPRLLCDFSPVVEWALSSYDAHLVKTGQLSVYSLLYGGDLALYRKRILAFVRALKHVGVAPIFFMEGAPGANVEHLELQYPALLSQHEHQLQQCTNVYQVCEGMGGLLGVHWRLSQDAESEIARCLQSEGVPLRYCARGTTVEMIEYQRRHRSVLGVLSSNTDFAIAAGSKLFPLSLFDLDDDLGIGLASIYPTPDKITCERVDPSTVSQSLHLTGDRDLIDISILCGNRFTSKLNRSCEVIRDLGIQGKGFEQVARLVGEMEPEQWQYVTDKLPDNPTYCKAIAQSLDWYGLRELWRDSTSPLDIVDQKTSKFGTCEVLRVERKLYDATLAAVGNGMYWRWPVYEPKNLGQPCFSDLTLPLRKTAYSLLGRETVCEYGCTSTKTFDEVFVRGDAGTDYCFAEMSDTRLVALFHLLTSYAGGKLETLEDDVASLVRELDKDLLPVLPAMVLPCASLCFMQHLVFEQSYQLGPDDLQALLMTCIFCSLLIPPVIIPEHPSSRSLRVAMQFCHVLQQARLLASTLHVADSLPLPSSVFYPLAFIPHSMASLANREPSSNLREAFHNSQLVLNKPPIQDLLLEITNNWQKPNLCLLLSLFYEAKVCIENLSVYLFQGSRLSPPPPPLQLIFEEKARGEVLDFSETVADDCEAPTPETAGDGTRGEMLNITDQLVPGSSHFLEDSLSEGEKEERDAEEGENEGSEQCGKEVNGEENAVESVDEEADSVNEEVLEQPLEFHSQSLSVAPECEEDHTSPRTPSSISSSSSSMSLPYSLSSKPPTPSPLASPQSERRQYVDLPISAHRRKLLRLIEEHRVVCVEGETGCGKSTRVPQYILEHSLSQSPPRPCRILVTQPRRMAAVKLAERVADERGERVGHTVGYCVGGDRTNLSGAAITYCTTGYLLQTLVHNPDTVDRYTHIILDEIHERSTDADFTLLVVRELLETRSPSVKLIIMSATMQSSLVVKYLKESFESVAGPYFVGVKHYGVDTYFIDEVGTIPQNQSFWDERQLKAAENLKVLSKISSIETSLAARPLVTFYMQEVCTNVIISQAHMGESTLVFLPGYNEIVHYFEHLKARLEDMAVVDHFRLFVLHSQVPLEDQREAFIDPPPNLTHVILATNIAESSITLPKLRMVINFGIYRRLQYDSQRHISCLVRSWCSRASCEQRAGRAGRVFVGTVVHLFTRRFYRLVLPAYDPPEILTSPISKLVLQAKVVGKKIGHPRPSDFLSLAITPPHLRQLEAALQDLGRLGAIESSPGEDVDEEADITFLGRFSLSLPVDLDLSRVVLCGVIFGCAVDALVIAASMSLLRDVLSLPTRMLIKDESVFRASLLRSYKNRCELDAESYSDAVVVCNLFKKWLAYRLSCCKEQCSKYRLAQRFSSLNACRWERLLQLEATAGEIAQKTLHHLPPNSAVHRELQKLASLCRFKFFSHAESSHSSIADFSIEFCEDVDIIRAMLVASYPDHLLFGVRQCESLKEPEKVESQTLLELMRSTRVDLAQTIVISGGKKSNKATVQQLVKTVLPNNFFGVNAFGSTYLLTLNHTFETNPLTALLHNLNIVPPNVMAGEKDGSKIVASTLPPELMLFWQFGERRPQWKAGDIDVNFSRPRHPLATTWFRMTEEREKVQILSWRNPTGLVCEVDHRRKPLPFLAVASHLQGSDSRSLVSASHVTLLPSLHGGRNALLLALTFQPLSTPVCVQVDYKHHQIVGLSINSFSLSPLPHDHFLNRGDVENMNCLRRAISRVFTSELTQVSAELLSQIPQLLSRLLASGREPREPRANTGSTREWEVVTGKRGRADEVMDSESEPEDEEQEEERPEGKRTLDPVEFEYLPPFQCSVFEQSEKQSEVQERGEEGRQEELGPRPTTTTGSYSDTESESRRSFKLSPNAPVFVPSTTPETELQSAAVHSDLDDHRSSDHVPTEKEDSSAAAPFLPLPTPTVPNLNSSHFLNPSLFSSMSVLPPDQQSSVWQVLARLDRVMKNTQCGDLKPASPHSPSVSDQPRPATHMKTQPEVYGGSAVAASVEPTLKEAVAAPSQLPPIITAPYILPYPSVQHSVVHPTTSRRTNFEGVVRQPSTQQQSPYQQLRRCVKTSTPQFPQPYTAYPSQLPTIPRPSYALPAVASATLIGLASAKPISPPLVPHHSYSKVQRLTTRNMPPQSPQFSKYARKPLLIDSLQSKLDLSSRAPGARVNSVGSRYRPRFPAPASLPRPSLSFFGFGGVSKKTQSLGHPQYPLQDSSRGSTEVAPHSIAPSPQPTSPLPRSQRDYSIICNALVSYLFAHLKAHGPSGKATSLIKSFLQENGLPWEVGGVLIQDLSAICRGRLSVHHSDDDVIVSLPQCLPWERSEPVMTERGERQEQLRPEEGPTTTAVPEAKHLSGGELAGQWGAAGDKRAWATTAELQSDGRSRHSGAGDEEKQRRVSEVPPEHREQDDGEEPQDVQDGGIETSSSPERTTCSESECTSNPTEEELIDSVPLDEESTADIEETLMKEEAAAFAASSEDERSNSESEDMNITLLGVEEEVEIANEVETEAAGATVEMVLKGDSPCSTKPESEEAETNVTGAEESGVVALLEMDSEIGTLQVAVTVPGTETEADNAQQTAVTKTVEENEATAPQTAVEENEVTAPQTAVEENEATAPQTAVEEENEVTAPQTAVEENEATAPQTTVEEEDAPQTAVEKENEVTAPQTAVEEENEANAPQTAVEEENEATAPQTAVEEENEAIAPQTAVEEETKENAALTLDSEAAVPRAVVQEDEMSKVTTQEKELKSTPQAADTVVVVRADETRTSPAKAKRKPCEVTVRRTLLEELTVKSKKSGSHATRPPEVLTDRQLGVVVACLTLVGGHSHPGKLGNAYRTECSKDAFLTLGEFASHPEVLRIKGNGCVFLRSDIEVEKAVTPVSLKPETEEIMRMCKDYCYTEKRNIGGSLKYKYTRRDSLAKGRRVSEAESGKEGERQRREKSHTPVRTRKSWGSVEFRRCRRRSLSPHFPRDVRSPKNPGHICHVLKFYSDFFATRTEAILYSDLLREYVSATHLPSEFYLPSDLLKHNFDVYRKDNKRYIRPLMQTENTPPVSADGVTSKTGTTEGTAADKQEPTCEAEKPKRSRSSSKLKSNAASNFKSKRDKDVCGSTKPVPVSQAEDEHEQLLPSTPYNSMSPTQPGHSDHILKFYTDLFARCGRPLPLKGFSYRYLRHYSMPKEFSIPQSFCKKHFLIFPKRGMGHLICPRLWREGHGETPTVSPVSREPLPLTEVWGEESREPPVAPVSREPLPLTEVWGEESREPPVSRVSREPLPLTEVWGEESREPPVAPVSREPLPLTEVWGEESSEPDTGRSTGTASQPLEKGGEEKDKDGPVDVDGGIEEGGGEVEREGGEEGDGKFSGPTKKNLPHGGCRRGLTVELETDPQPKEEHD